MYTSVKTLDTCQSPTSPTVCGIGVGGGGAECEGVQVRTGWTTPDTGHPPLHQCGDGAAIGVGESGCVPILRPLTQVPPSPAACGIEVTGGIGTYQSGDPEYRSPALLNSVWYANLGDKNN